MKTKTQRYETPAVEVINVTMEVSILSGEPGTTDPLNPPIDGPEG